MAKNAWKLGEDRASMRYLRDTHPRGICQLNALCVQRNVEVLNISKENKMILHTVLLVTSSRKCRRKLQKEGDIQALQTGILYNQRIACITCASPTLLVIAYV